MAAGALPTAAVLRLAQLCLALRLGQTIWTRGRRVKLRCTAQTQLLKKVSGSGVCVCVWRDYGAKRRHVANTEGGLKGPQ